MLDNLKELTRTLTNRLKNPISSMIIIAFIIYFRKPFLILFEVPKETIEAIEIAILDKQSLYGYLKVIGYALIFAFLYTTISPFLMYVFELLSNKIEACRYENAAIKQREKLNFENIKSISEEIEKLKKEKENFKKRINDYQELSSTMLESNEYRKSDIIGIFHILKEGQSMSNSDLNTAGISNKILEHLHLINIIEKFNKRAKVHYNLSSFGIEIQNTIKIYPEIFSHEPLTIPKT